MKDIRLKSIAILNFKGIRNQEIAFGTEGTTTISGRNATGKSTVRDAFLWLMFDKNAAGEKDFGIKTNDADGNPIPRIPHEVSATLLVNGDEIRLRKCLAEKWVKKSGAVDKVFSGNTAEYYINDVPKKAGEYNAYISELCDETVFRAITNPAYLPGMRKDQLRATLFNMTGKLTDAEIAGDDAELSRLLDLITGKSIEELQKQTAAEKAHLRKELSDIPARIDELERSKPEPEDWNALENDKEATRAELTGIEERIEDASKAIEAANEERLRLSRELSDKRLTYSTRLNELQRKAMEGYNKEVSEQKELRSTAAFLESKNSGIQAEMTRVKRSIDNLKAAINERQDRLGELRGEWGEINASRPSFNEDEFICPMCRRPLEAEDIEARKEEMIENFNRDKAAKLNANKAAGLAKKEEIESLLRDIKDNDARIAQLNEEVAKNDRQIKVIKSNPLFGKAIERQEAVIKDEVLDSLSAEIAGLDERVSKPLSPMGTAELKVERTRLVARLADIRERLYKKQHIDHINARIDELTERQRDLSQLIADKEQVESWIERFNRRKVEMTESRINSLFAMVRWRMYNKLINGGEEPTCVPLINGVEYRDANAAAKTNGGLDIINAVCQYYGVYAPIFVDNAEGINELLPTNSQMIRLVVSTEPELTVSYE